MTEEHDPNVEDLKAQERVEIPVDDMDEEAQKEQAGAPEADVAEALRNLGRQFAETLQTAWNSQERLQFEREVREGVRRFGDEVNQVLRETKESPAAKKMKEEAEEVRTRVESGDISRKARGSLVEGLHWMSQELDRLARQFSPTEESAESTDTTQEQAPAEDASKEEI